MKREKLHPIWYLHPTIFAVVGLVFVALAGGELATNLRYSNAIQTTGVVTGHYTPRGEDTTALVVEWTDASGAVHEVVSSVRTNRPTAVGTRVPVQYFDGDPGSARVATWSEKWFAFSVFGGMGALFVAGAGGVAYWILRSRKYVPDVPDEPTDQHRSE